MPIYYACLLNRRKEIVLQGSYSTVQNFRDRVIKAPYEEYSTKEIFLDNSIKLHYRNMSEFILCAVSDEIVSLEEAAKFLDKFFRQICTEILQFMSDPSAMPVDQIHKGFAPF